MVVKKRKYLDNLLSKFHKYLLANHRENTLASHLQSLIPPKSNLLDVGCGGGYMSNKIQKINSDIVISGIDIFKREKSYIPVKSMREKLYDLKMEVLTVY